MKKIIIATMALIAFGCSQKTAPLTTNSFINTDGKLVVVVMNQSREKVLYNLCIGTKAAEITILPHAIQTLIL
jgi:hypothetical protein